MLRQGEGGQEDRAYGVVGSPQTAKEEGDGEREGRKHAETHQPDVGQKIEASAGASQMKADLARVGQHRREQSKLQRQLDGGIHLDGNVKVVIGVEQNAGEDRQKPEQGHRGAMLAHTRQGVQEGVGRREQEQNACGHAQRVGAACLQKDASRQQKAERGGGEGSVRSKGGLLKLLSPQQDRERSEQGREQDEEDRENGEDCSRAKIVRCRLVVHEHGHRLKDRRGGKQPEGHPAEQAGK